MRGALRGARHKGFSALMRRISARSSASIFGRPLPPQHNQLWSAAFSASSRLFDSNGEVNRVRKKQQSSLLAIRWRIQYA
jgi:hypothetical protein